MTPQQLLYRIQRLPNVDDIVVRAVYKQRSSEELSFEVQSPIEITYDEYLWEVRAVWRDKWNGETRNATTVNDNLTLAIVSMFLKIELPTSGVEDYFT